MEETVQLNPWSRQARDFYLPWTELDIKFYKGLDEIRLFMGKPLSEFSLELALNLIRLPRHEEGEDSQLDEGVKQLAQEIMNSPQIWSQLNMAEQISWFRVSMGLAPSIKYSIRTTEKMEQSSNNELEKRLESTKKAKAIVTKKQEFDDHPVSVKETEPEIGGLSQNDRSAPAIQQPMVQLQRSDKPEKVFLPKNRSTSIEISCQNRPNNGFVGADFKGCVDGIASANPNFMVQDGNILGKPPG